MIVSKCLSTGGLDYKKQLYQKATVELFCHSQKYKLVLDLSLNYSICFEQEICGQMQHIIVINI